MAVSYTHLTGHAGLATAFLNDVNGEMIYAQQLYGYGKKGDVFMGISTSGNAENVMYAEMCIRDSNKSYPCIFLSDPYQFPRPGNRYSYSP